MVRCLSSLTSALPPDMSVAGFGASNGTPSLRPGGWGSPGQQQSAWAAAPPSANPFMVRRWY